jgi:hypothetical protein
MVPAELLLIGIILHLTLSNLKGRTHIINIHKVYPRSDN